MARRYGYGFKVMVFKIVDQSRLSVQTQGSAVLQGGRNRYRAEIGANARLYTYVAACSEAPT